MTLRGILAAQLALQALGTYEVRAVGLSCHLCSPGRRSLICWRMPWVLVNALWAFAQILSVGLGFAPLSELLGLFWSGVQIRFAL